MTKSQNIFNGGSVKQVISNNPFHNVVHFIDEETVQGNT